MRRMWRRALVQVALLACLAASTHAQGEPVGAADAAGAAEGVDDSRAAAFQAVEGALEEDVPGGPLLIAAYGIIWLVIFGYAWRLVGLQRRTLEEIEQLQQVLREAPPVAGGAGDEGDAPGGRGDTE